MNYMEVTTNNYKHDFATSYGHVYPESHIIFTYNQILKHEFGVDGSGGEKLLDFGCSTGAHCLFFKTKGFDVYGVDIDTVPIEKCRERMPDIESHFSVIDPKPDRNLSFFNEQFDIILSNQVLYYFSDTDFDEVIYSLSNQLKPGGFVILTMMGKPSEYYNMSEPYEDGLRRIVFKGRLSNKGESRISYINFTGSEAELIRRFSLFEKRHVGFYSHQIREDEGIAHHYMFVGQKALLR